MACMLAGHHTGLPVRVLCCHRGKNVLPTQSKLVFLPDLEECTAGSTALAACSAAAKHLQPRPSSAMHGRECHLILGLPRPRACEGSGDLWGVAPRDGKQPKRITPRSLGDVLGATCLHTSASGYEGDGWAWNCCLCTRACWEFCIMRNSLGVWEMVTRKGYFSKLLRSTSAESCAPGVLT